MEPAVLGGPIPVRLQVVRKGEEEEQGHGYCGYLMNWSVAVLNAPLNNVELCLWALNEAPPPTLRPLRPTKVLREIIWRRFGELDRNIQ